MEVPAVADAITALLAPFLALLTRIGAGTVDHAIDKAGERIDAKAWALAKDVWACLRHRAADDPALKETADTLAADPTYPAARNALRSQLERMLASDPSLARELNQLLTARMAPQQTNTAGEINIGVQGSIHGGTITAIGKQSDRDP
jgi:hypothetical protein